MEGFGFVQIMTDPGGPKIYGFGHTKLLKFFRYLFYRTIFRLSWPCGIPLAKKIMTGWFYLQNYKVRTCSTTAQGIWVAKLVARLIAMATLWVRIQT
jgi:hypothetical protein